MPELKKMNELDGTVLMVGDEVAWTGPLAVLGKQQEEDVEEQAADGEVLGVADGSDYTPPPEETPE